jgi:hypothetical protein
MAKKLIIFYGTWRYIAMFTTNYHHALLSHAQTFTSLRSLSMLSSHSQLCIPRDLVHPVKYTILLIPTMNMTISECPNTATNLNVAWVQQTAQLQRRTALYAFKHLHVREARVMFRSTSSGITSAQWHRTPKLPDIYGMFWIFNYKFMSPTEPNYGAMTNESVTK